MDGQVDSDTYHQIKWCKSLWDRQAGRQATGRERETDLRATVIGKNTSGLIWIIIIPNISARHLNSISVIFSVLLCENLTFQGHAFLGHHLAEGQKCMNFLKKPPFFLQNDN